MAIEFPIVQEMVAESAVALQMRAMSSDQQYSYYKYWAVEPLELTIWNRFFAQKKV